MACLDGRFVGSVSAASSASRLMLRAQASQALAIQVTWHRRKYHCNLHQSTYIFRACLQVNTTNGILVGLKYYINSDLFSNHLSGKY